MKFSVNHPCPCGSNTKYKKCCQVFHKGKVALNADELMRSRYSAYFLKDAAYIIKTTDINNPDYTPETSSWSDDILEFCNASDFRSLKVLEFIDGDDEAYVEFHVELYIRNEDQSFTEKSKFVKRDGAWFYHSAEFK